MTSANDVKMSDPVAHRSVVAKRIADEVFRSPERGPKLAKVSSLIHAFRAPDASTRFSDVRNALEDADLELDCGWPTVQRSGVVRISALRGSERDNDAGSATESFMRMSVWGSDVKDDCSFPPHVDFDKSGVLWFDIDPVAVAEVPVESEHKRREWKARSASRVSHLERGDAAVVNDRDADRRVRANEVVAQIGQWCPGLREEMVFDLLSEDVQPKVETYGDDKGDIRGVSVVAAIAEEVPAGGELDELSEEVVFQLLEIIVGDGWMITCWHPSRAFRGATENDLGAPILREPFISQVRHRWLSEIIGGDNVPIAKTSGDLGLLLVRSLIDTYDATNRMMERWLASWEVEFTRSLKRSDRAARLKEAATEISNFLYMTAEIRRRLTAFLHARLSTTNKTWFPDPNGRESRQIGNQAEPAEIGPLQSAVEAAKANFDRLHGDIQANMDLLMLQSTATQQEASERVQGYLGKITGLVLVPTFIAGLFGANTRIPGGGTWMGFGLMLTLMLVSGVGVYFIIRKIAS